jgi:hypothetical protein
LHFSSIALSICISYTGNVILLRLRPFFLFPIHFDNKWTIAYTNKKKKFLTMKQIFNSQLNLWNFLDFGDHEYIRTEQKTPAKHNFCSDRRRSSSTPFTAVMNMLLWFFQHLSHGYCQYVSCPPIPKKNRRLKIFVLTRYR